MRCSKPQSIALPGIIILLLSIPFFAFSQRKEFAPVIQDSIALHTLLVNYQQQFDQDLVNLPAINKKDLSEVYRLRWKSIEEKFDKQEIFLSASAQSYLNQIVSEIRKSNPSISKTEFSCYFSRSYIPNASYIGEGLILFNMGLFQRLDNESELAFILCHEIAHFLLQHAEKSMNDYVTMMNSKATQAELSKIKKSEYGKRERLLNLVEGLTFDSRRHSRSHESQADSMAVELLRNTRFSISGAVTTMEKLDVIDTDTLNIADCLAKMFNATQYPFQKRWLSKDAGLLGGLAKLAGEEMADSLKTHPDCKKRIELLRNQMKDWRQTTSSNFILDSVRFVNLRDDFRYETAEYAYIDKNYTRSLFLTMELINAKPGDAYLVTHIGKLLNGLYIGQKTHTLGKVIDYPSPGNQPNYNLLLQFVQNLYLDEIAGINYYFLLRYQSQMSAYTPFRRVFSDSERFFHD